MRFIRGAGFGLFLACLPMLSAGCASVSPKLSVLPSLARHRAESQYQAARSAEQRGQLTKARDLYAALQRQSPNTPEYAHRMGVVCTQLQDYQTAGKYFEHARSLDSRNPAILADMGYSAYLQKDYASAEALLKDSVQLRPDDPRAVNNLAMSIGFQGRYDECQEVFRRVNPETQSLLNVAFIQVQRNEPETAMVTYERVLSQEPGNKMATSALQQLTSIHPRRNQVARAAIETADRSGQPPRNDAHPTWENDPSTSLATTSAPSRNPEDLPPPVIASADELSVPNAVAGSPVITPHDGNWAPTPTVPKLSTASNVVSQEGEFELPQRMNPPAELESDDVPEETVVEKAGPAPDEMANVFEGDDNAPETALAGMDELTGLDWAKEDLARAKEAAESGGESSPCADDLLRGYCPVALRDERRLAAALDDFATEYHAQNYRFSSAEAREKFLEHPDWYVPAAGGLDVIEVKRGLRVTAGSLDFAVWFRHRLHMFSNAENLAAFRAAPRQFAVSP